MLSTAYRLLVLLFLVPALYAQAQNRKPQFQKEPAWVTPNNFPDTSDRLNADAEDGVVDLAYEKQISLEARAVYTRRAIKFLSKAGVQNNSEVSINFDPAYQQLTFHKVRLIRNGHILDRLQLAKVKTVQQEKDLNSFIYNGSLTAMLFLEDVQEGDVLEYSYTITGFNPIFGDRYSGTLDIGFSVPIYRVYYKLLAPRGSPLKIKNSKTSIQPSITQTKDETTYEWRLANVPALHVDDNIPSWYDPYPIVMISAFQNWKEVNDWARTLFSFDVPLSEALRSKVAELKRNYTDPASQAQAALRFVQDDIRYLGIEMGENSHKPHQPDEILRQRFGDCKDKSYLLCTLLRALGIEANPVLINSSYRKTIAGWLPAPTDFDHTTVQVRLNGKQYWFDPTIAFQRGPLDAISYPDYGAGLVITDTTTQLTDIPFHSKGAINIKEIFDVPDMNSQVKLQVVTDYSGSFADNTRDDFKSNSNFEMRKTYRDFYEYYFKNIKADSLKVSDNEATGVFTTKEYYTLGSIWEDSIYLKKTSFEPYVINSLLKKPDGAARTMPYALRYPAHYSEEIQVNLPENWELKHSDHSSESALFKFNADYTCTGKKIVLKYEYESLKDHIMPEEVTAYIQKVDKANEGIAYSLTSATFIEDSGRSGISSNTYTSLYVALGLCVFITYTVRKRNR